MKITAVRLERLSRELDPPFFAAWDPSPRKHFDATVVRVQTDEGVTGIASGDTMTGFEEFAELFVGRDPFALAAHARTLETISFHAGRYWPLEAALWDLCGKALGVPVATLLGGRSSSLPAYASLGELRAPEQRAEDASALVEQGFKAVKVRIARDRLSDGVAVVAAIRDAVGDALEILVDLNQWWRMAGDIRARSRGRRRAAGDRAARRVRRAVGRGARRRRRSVGHGGPSRVLPGSDRGRRDGADV